MTRRTVTSIGAWAVAFVLPVPAALCSEIGEEIADQVRLESYRHFLDTQLFTRVGDDRGYDSPQHDLARENIVAIFESYGLDVELHPFEYYGGTYYNVVATQIGTVYPEAQYIVGAHYDSASNPGADDDASGVAGLLEIARILSAYETEYTVKYIAFDLEEMGLVGSEAYVADHLADDIRAMVQMDMISWNNGTLMCQIRGREASDPIKSALADAFAEYATGVEALIRPPPSGYRSDHVSFEDAGFQACWLVENGFRHNPHFHSARDTVDMLGYVDYWYGAELLRGMAGFLADHAVAGHPYDCDGNGVADADQVEADPGLDCNANHILDVCEFAGDQDLNGNGVPDLCDIHAGTSGDCNGNWVPDEVEPGYGEDCNGDGVTDFCDLAEHVSEDLNGNGVPDECEPHGTIYVDDDAPNDPGPGDPNVSDPDEDGSAEHPFDSIVKAVALSVSGDEILARPGLYSGVGNRAVSFGGRRIAVRSEDGPATCVIDPEGSDRAFSIRFGQTSETRLDGFTIRNASGRSGPALAVRSADPLIANCIFENNVALDHGGAVLCWYGGPTFANCIFHANRVEDYENADGGGAVYCWGSSAMFVNCVFRDNHTLRDSADGGAIYFGESDGAVVRDCTFVGNSAPDGGGAIVYDFSSGSLRNSILWNNQAQQGSEVALLYWVTLEVTYCDVAGGSEGVFTEGSNNDLIWGPGNIDADPLFVDAESFDLRLLPGSPCIDAGDNSAVPVDMLDLDGDGDTDEPIPFDLDGNPRFADDPGMPDGGNGTPPIVDMGAYEFQGETCFGDLDGDDAIGLADLARLLSSYGTTSGAVYTDGDVDRDGDVDLTDLAALLGVYGTTCP